jgi:hypothetical protein
MFNQQGGEAFTMAGYKARVEMVNNTHITDLSDQRSDENWGTEPGIKAVWINLPEGTMDTVPCK